MVSRELAIIKANGLTLDDVCECGSKEFIINPDSQYVCKNCSLVYSFFYENSEKKFYNNEEKIEKKTHEIVYENKIRTFFNIDEAELKGDSLKIFRYMLKLNNSSYSNTEINYNIAKNYLNCISSKLEVSKNVVRVAWELYKMAYNENLIMGRKIDNFINVCLYVGIRINNSSISISEILEQSLCNEKSFMYNLSLFKKKVLVPNNITYKPLSSANYVYTIGYKLKLKEKTKLRAARLAEKFSKMQCSIGKNPKGIAAAAVYIECRNSGLKKTELDIIEKSHIKESTLRHRLNDFRKYFGKDIIKNKKNKIDKKR